MCMPGFVPRALRTLGHLTFTTAMRQIAFSPLLNLLKPGKSQVNRYKLVILPRMQKLWETFPYSFTKLLQVKWRDIIVCKETRLWKNCVLVSTTRRPWASHMTSLGFIYFLPEITRVDCINSPPSSLHTRITQGTMKKCQCPNPTPDQFLTNWISEYLGLG